MGGNLPEFTQSKVVTPITVDRMREWFSTALEEQKSKLNQACHHPNFDQMDMIAQQKVNDTFQMAILI